MIWIKPNKYSVRKLDQIWGTYPIIFSATYYKPTSKITLVRLSPLGLTRWFSASMPTFLTFFVHLCKSPFGWAVLPKSERVLKNGNPLKYKRINQERIEREMDLIYGNSKRFFQIWKSFCSSATINMLYKSTLTPLLHFCYLKSLRFQISLFWHLEKFKMKSWLSFLTTLAFTVSLISMEKSPWKSEVTRQSELGNYSKAAVALDSQLCASVGK